MREIKAASTVLKLISLQARLTGKALPQPPVVSPAKPLEDGVETTERDVRIAA